MRKMNAHKSRESKTFLAFRVANSLLLGMTLNGLEYLEKFTSSSATAKILLLKWHARALVVLVGSRPVRQCIGEIRFFVCSEKRWRDSFCLPNSFH